MPSVDPPRRPLPSDLKRSIASRAATLAERVVAGRGFAATEAPPGADPEAALQTWRQAFAPADDRAFARRLAWDGLDLDTARRAVAGWVPAPGAALPGWTAWLDAIAAEASGVAADWSAGRLAEADPSRWTDEPPFVELWVAPLRAARRALASVVAASTRDRITGDARWALERQLVREVGLWGGAAAFETFEAGPAGDGRYRAFVSRQLEGGLADLFDRFPVLARQIACLLGGWVAASRELLERLDTDAAALAEALGGGQPTGPVVRIEPALSDPHLGRRRVVALGFESGLQVVYKPRDVQAEAALASLLEWAGGARLDPPLPAPRVLCRDDYGWVERLVPGEWPTADSVDRFHRQAGVLLAVAHVLRGRDLHMENVVATAAGPVLVDVEMLCQPVRGAPATAPADLHGTDASCLTTGLLSAFEADETGAVFDIGGLRGAAAAVAASGSAWTGLRTDALARVDRPVPRPAIANRVVRGGLVESVEAHAASVVDGFVAAYRWFLDHRAALVAADGPLAPFGRGRTRVLLRPTNQYAMLVDLLRTPRYQRDGARASAAIDVLLRPFSRSASRPPVWDLLVAERQALEQLDIPRFELSAAGTDVRSGAQIVAPGAVARSGIDAVRDRVRSLSTGDLDRQRRRLTHALAETPAARFAAVPPPRAPGASPPWVDAARWVGVELRRLVLGPGADGPRVDPDACPHRLYDGTLGPAVCFAALATVTGDPMWADAARAALEPAQAAIAGGDDLDRWARGGGIGAGDGLGSLVYGLTTAGALIGDRAPLDAAGAVAGFVGRHVERDTQLDVVGGAAGAILALLALDGVRPDPALRATAAACGRHLLAHAVPRGGGLAWPGVNGRHAIGFAHGAAGIAFALDRLHGRTRETAFGDAAAAGFRFVRHWYLPGGHWPVADVPDDDPVGAAPSMMAWCHGAPGVTLGLALAGALAGEGARAEMEAALAQAARWLPARPDHLCCGTLGRCEVLLAVGRRLGRPGYERAARALATRVVDRACEAGHFRLSAPGVEYRVFDPGFFRGLSGIGYGLLRLARPDRLPSILAFDHPGDADHGKTSPESSEGGSA